MVKPIEREKEMARIKVILDDAQKIEDILILHKNTGSCVFFQSYALSTAEEIIRKLLDTVVSFGEDLPLQEVVNILPFQARKLLISDGNFIRVAVVIGKDPSTLIYRDLTEFVDFFERTYAQDLADWKYQLETFKNTEPIIDQFLFPSMVLSHQLSYDLSNLDAILDAHSQEVFNVASKLVNSTRRNAFFITTLLKAASETSEKKLPEILKSIKELKYKKILIPMEISRGLNRAITQLEIDYIKKNVSELIELEADDRKKLVSLLSDMDPVERMVYIYCFGIQRELISPPITNESGDVKIEDEKIAKKELNRLKKNAKSLKKAKDYLNAIEFSQKALRIVNQWDLMDDFEELNEIIRTSTIENLQSKMANLIEYAKSAAARSNHSQAHQNYTLAYKLALEIFNLGVAEASDDIKRFVNKAIRYQK